MNEKKEGWEEEKKESGGVVSPTAIYLHGLPVLYMYLTYPLLFALGFRFTGLRVGIYTSSKQAGWLVCVQAYRLRHTHTHMELDWIGSDRNPRYISQLPDTKQAS